MCKHIHKGLDQSHVRKALQNVEWDVCQDCKADSKTQEKAEEEETDEGTSIWLCLKCGHRVSLLLLICLNTFPCLIMQWNKRVSIQTLIFCFFIVRMVLCRWICTVECDLNMSTLNVKWSTWKMAQRHLVGLRLKHHLEDWFS